MRAIFWFLVAVLAAVAASFAVSNRLAVSLGLWPLPGAVEAPLYLIVLVALAAGTLFGLALGWYAGGKTRQQRRALRHKVQSLEREVAELRPQAGTPAPPTPALPAHRIVEA